MLEKIQLCNDTQVEYVLQRACLGVAKVNHLLRAGGIELSREQEALREFDQIQLQGIRRLMPGMTELGAEQVMRSLGFGGAGLQ
eukprot:6999253-Karenia_brevis.AAC.1